MTRALVAAGGALLAWAAFSLGACGGSKSSGTPAAQCGNGVTEAGEECDFGAANGPGAGCEASCTFSCTTSPDSCPDANVCNGAETCTPVTVGGHAGQRCMPAASAAPRCSACPGGLCISGSCAASSCGDGCLDFASGEQCEPPGTATCDATCHAIAVPGCGNGVRDAGEQCDDGGTSRLDGCDAACAFEQVHRIIWLQMQFAADTSCTANAFGAAFGSVAQSSLQAAIDASIADGTSTNLLQFLQLADLSGTSAGAVTLGVLGGAPAAGAGYDGTNDLDWWYTVDPASIDAGRNPVATLAGTMTAGVLDAGPGTISLQANLGGGPVPIALANARLTAAVGASTVPLASAGAPPGHLASEHLDPALASFATMGQPNAAGAGTLCGAVTAAALAAVPIPAALLSGPNACSQGYGATNTMLDVLVGGCTVFIFTAINPSQPDTADVAAPQAGAGPPYRLSAGAGRHVDACRDKSNAPATLDACLRSAAYSSYFKFATDRVVGK